MGNQAIILTILGVSVAVFVWNRLLVGTGLVARSRIDPATQYRALGA